MWWKIYFAAVLTKYIVVMYLHRNYIRTGVESGVEGEVECSETKRKEVVIWDQLPRRVRVNSYI
jgi:hypothetical protein